jgi:hypothetical protein
VSSSLSFMKGEDTLFLVPKPLVDLIWIYAVLDSRWHLNHFENIIYYHFFIDYIHWPFVNIYKSALVWF